MSALARHADPETSHDAAKKVNVTQRETDVLVALLGNPMNASEIAAKIGVGRDSVSPRMRAMERKELVEATTERRDGQIVWRVKQKVM